MKSTVMVTGTGQLGVGEGLMQCLLMERDNYRLISANANPYAATMYTADVGLVLPEAGEASYLDTLTAACKDNGVEFLIPGSEPELRTLADKHDYFAEFGCVLLCNQESVIQAGDDKFLTYEFLTEHGVPTPKSIRATSSEAAEELGYPLVIKPYSGGGGKNVHVVHSDRELELITELMRLRGVDVFLQEYVGDVSQEFTASALMAPEGEILGSFAARRRLAGGASATAEVRDFPEVRAVAEHIAVLLQATGPINIQARLHRGEISVFEINPRFSGSAPFRALCGFNEPHLMIQRILGEVHGHAVGRDAERTLDVLGIRSFDHTLVPLADVAALEDPTL